MNSNAQGGGDPLVYAAALGGVVLLMWIAWQAFGAQITAAVFIVVDPAIRTYVDVREFLTSAGVPLLISDFLFPPDLHETAEKNLRMIETSSPGSVPASEVARLLTYPASIVRPTLILALPFLLRLMFVKTRPSRRANRESIYSLAKRLAPLFPQIMVAIYDKAHKGGDDTGPYRREETPIRYAIYHGLLRVHQMEWDGALLDGTSEVTFDTSKVKSEGYLHVLDHLERGIAQLHGRCSFDENRATELFTRQLGPLWTSIEDLPVPHQLLFGAIALYAKGDKDRSYQLFWEINRRWNPRKPSKHLSFSPKYVANLIAEISTSEGVKYAIANHAYITTVFQGLLSVARKRGRIPSNLFYWLKRQDRTLWYALNQEGGQCGWTESAAARAHVLAERAVKKEVKETAESALYTPEIRECVKALYDTLYKEGWIADIYPPKLN